MRRTSVRLTFLVLASFLAHAIPAKAQTAGDIVRAGQQSERIQREQELRRQEDVQRSLENDRAPAHIEVVPPKTPQGHGEGCQYIWRIRITGGIHMADAKKEVIVKPFAGKCIGAGEIQKMLEDITAYYIEAGYATTRVYLPSQDLSTGTLHIDITEGIVSDVRLQEGDGGSVFLYDAFPGVKGDVLNLRDFEQGLDQINRLQSNNATLDITPGDKVGESVVVIRNNRSKRWHLNMSADDYGTTSTGKHQASATASYDNLLGINDYLSVMHRKTVPFNDYERQSTASSVLMSVPMGPATLTGGYSYSDYDSTLKAVGGDMHLDGDNRSLFGTLDYVLYRDQDYKVTASGTLTKKIGRNYIAGQKLGVSSRKLTVMDVGVNASVPLLGGSGTIGVGYSRGLKLLDALKDSPSQPDDAPRAQFEKYTLNASWFRPFTLGGELFDWSTQLTAQTAWDTLYGSEQISIGGIYTVRGFQEETLANDDGYYVRNDLTMHRGLGSVYGQTIMLSPYLALDAGAVTGRAPGTPHGTLIGGAAGFRLGAGPANFEMFTGHSLKAPDGMGEEGIMTFSRLSVTF